MSIKGKAQVDQLWALIRPHKDDLFRMIETKKVETQADSDVITAARTIVVSELVERELAALELEEQWSG